MLFSSVPFLYYFLPAVLLVYFLVPRFLKNTVLLLSSLVFYGWGEPKLLFLMIFTIAMFYGCGLAIGKAQQQKWKKIWLTVSVVISVALLGLFKYADFFISSFNLKYSLVGIIHINTFCLLPVKPPIASNIVTLCSKLYIKYFFTAVSLSVII